MRSNAPSYDELMRERAKIMQSGRLHWFHWTVVVLSLALTVGAWYFSKSQIEERTAEQFRISSEQFVELVTERMQKYEEGLWGGVSAIQSRGGAISYEDWLTFSRSLQIELRYPGINGIGVIHYVTPQRLDAYLAEQRQSRPDYGIHPPHDKSEYLPITYIEPLAINALAVGLDIAHENNRYQAALNARDTGHAQITGPIVLVQDKSKTPGFLFYAPYYATLSHNTVAERREQFLGMVYAPFVFHKLIEGTLDKDKRQVRVRVQDNGSVLYDEDSADDPTNDPNPLFRTQISLDLYGRTWTFDIWTTSGFRVAHSNSQPIIILVAGFLIDLLLLTLFVLLTQANRRAIRFVDATTSELRQRSDALQESNRELESFAYAASHDLKAPLRGISKLAAWIEEDIGEAANEDVRNHTQLLHGRINRMESLLDGLLQYSRAGRGNAEAERVDLAIELPELFKLLSPPPEFALKVATDMPAFSTAAAPLEQVFRNLMSNAIKHHDSDAGTIQIDCRDLDDMYEFTVTDDGPGIEPAFHDRVFGIFQTLRSRDEVEGSGIGLSIVKRIVISVGGSIAVESEPERKRGTTFRFTWPKNWRASESMASAA